MNDAEETFDGIYETECEVRKNKNKEVKVEMGLSVTCPKLEKGDRTDEMEDLKEYHTEIGIKKNKNEAYLDGSRSFEFDNKESCGNETDENKTFKHKQKSAETGDINRLYQYGHYYQKGPGKTRVNKEYNGTLRIIGETTVDHNDETEDPGDCHQVRVGVETNDRKKKNG
ncbi:hypothetical protein F8M41_012618 [Gigaspora margarita]|uniref:Uncharacterized protein n=1 Tax=Gigaspora margarita TaxID=4874 RepID=A0A8H4EPC4_GIGMA|nr:hypothetical protein F8M41_012618 [Gigaspora margarita]